VDRLGSGREKLIRINAKVVRHGRYLTFQLAEAAISRALFNEILRLIGGLRPRLEHNPVRLNWLRRRNFVPRAGAGRSM
jgi:hypothetical protein